MCTISNHDSVYKFFTEDGMTVVVEIEHSGDFYRAADTLADTIRDLPLAGDQRPKLLKEILDLVQVCEADAIMQTLLNYDAIMGRSE